MAYTPNTAGSFPMASIYPGMGNGIDQRMETTPEPEEQAVLTNQDSPAGSAVDPKSKLNIWMLLGGMILLVVLFGKG